MSPRSCRITAAILSRARLSLASLTLGGLALASLTLGGLACTPKSPTIPPTIPPTNPDSNPDDQPPMLRDKASILAASKLPEPLPTPLADDPMGVTIHRLSNGLTVYISPDREEPRVTAWLAIRSGSRNDPADSTGLAHYLEHMLFKGTERLGTLDYAAEAPHIARIAELYGELRDAADPQARTAIFAAIDAETQATAATAIPNELDRTYAELGITGVNAFTSDDETVYIAQVPRNRLQQWATVEADRLQRPVFRLFYPELEAVYEEKNISLDDPEERVWDTNRRLLFPRHPYGTQPTIGHIEHLKTPAYGDMVAYFERWYLPNNAAIILAGDVDPAAALPILEATFGTWEARPLATPAPAELPPLRGRIFEELVAEGEETVWIAWPTVDANHADADTLEVLDLLVDNATAGLLHLELLLPQRVPAASTLSEALREAGYWGLSATAREGQPLAEVEGLLLEITSRLKAGDFTAEDLAAVVLQAEIETKRRLESNGARAWRMAEAFLLGQPWPVAARHIERLRAVTRDQVIAAARRYLGDDRVVIYRRRGEHQPPRIDKPSISPVPLDPSRRSPFAAALLAEEIPAIEPLWLREGEHYSRLETAGGPLITSVNQRNDLFSLSYRFEVGERRRPLLCYALELLELSGAADLEAIELRRHLFSLGTTFSSRCDDHQITLTLEGIDRNLEASVELLGRWLASPRFTEETLGGLLANTLSQRRDALEDPEFLGAALAAYAAYGPRSPYLAEPSNAALKGARRPQLTRELRDLLGLAHTTLYFGPRPPAAAAEATLLGSKHRQLTPRPPLRLREVERPTLFFLHRTATQAQIRLHAAAPPLAPAERAPAALLNQVLGGDMSGLIFQELREARGLAYSAYAAISAGARADDPAALRGYIGTQADKAPQALELLDQLLRAPPITGDRLEPSRAALLAEYRSDRIPARSRPYTVFSWLESGESGDPRLREFAALPGLDSAAIRAFASRFAKPWVISVIGDRGRLDLAALRRIATIEELTPADLVSYGPTPAENRPKDRAARTTKR